MGFGCMHHCGGVELVGVFVVTEIWGWTIGARSRSYVKSNCYFSLFWVFRPRSFLSLILGLSSSLWIRSSTVHSLLRWTDHFSASTILDQGCCFLIIGYLRTWSTESLWLFRVPHLWFRVGMLGGEIFPRFVHIFWTVIVPGPRHNLLCCFWEYLIEWISLLSSATFARMDQLGASVDFAGVYRPGPGTFCELSVI